MTSVTFKVENKVGFITLNRPRVINSLNLEMVGDIYNQLKKWEDDENIDLVCINGNGEKGFCAGGDMVAFYDERDDAVEVYAMLFLGGEYLVDYLIHNYPKPVISYMNGIVMGGGVGISIGASHRIVTETTKWAMPEMNIGFFPDVAGSYFLSRMPGQIGTYLALTGEVIRAEDVLYVGAADIYIEETSWGALLNDVKNEKWKSGQVKEQLDLLLKKYEKTYESANITSYQKKVDEHFKYETVEAIIESLQKASDQGDDWAKDTLATVLSKSPTSLKVALRQLQKGKKSTLKECFEMEFALGMNFMQVADFYEGVRAVLVDKDRDPKWKPSLLKDVKLEDIEKMFEHPIELFA